MGARTIEGEKMFKDCISVGLRECTRGIVIGDPTASTTAVISLEEIRRGYIGMHNCLLLSQQGPPGGDSSPPLRHPLMLIRVPTEKNIPITQASFCHCVLWSLAVDEPNSALI